MARIEGRRADGREGGENARQRGQVSERTEREGGRE